MSRICHECPKCSSSNVHFWTDPEGRPWEVCCWCFNCGHAGPYRLTKKRALQSWNLLPDGGK